MKKCKRSSQPVVAITASNIPTTNPPLSPAAPPPAAPSPFTDFVGLCAYLPQYKPRTLRAMVKARILPHIRPPSSRKLGFYKPAVEAAMLRFSKGGIEA